LYALPPPDHPHNLFYRKKRKFSNGGSVGIGQTNPAEKLHVSGGNVKVDSGYGYLINSVKIVSGSGSPNTNSVVAVPGSLYLNTAGGAGATLWVKESGTGGTGWVAK
jgi:hypothetical protein